MTKEEQMIGFLEKACKLINECHDLHVEIPLDPKANEEVISSRTNLILRLGQLKGYLNGGRDVYKQLHDPTPPIRD